MRSDALKLCIEALEKIARWHGEFPDVPAEAKARHGDLSYGSMYGSNGERDYMRQVARDAIKKAKQR